ncbi:MAG: lysophospholipid acyltransferase family protein [Gammaproteobacteria bacterium]
MNDVSVKPCTPFQLAPRWPDWSMLSPRNQALRVLEQASGLAALNKIYQSCDWPDTAAEFIAAVLAEFRIDYRMPARQRDHVPAAGGAIVVANHPMGALDGLLAAQILGSVRTDFKILVNYHLDAVPQLRDLFITVDPYGGDESASRNRQPLREAIRFVRNGGLLLVFPAGEVAHWSARKRKWRESDWHPAIGQLVRLTNVPVIPMHFQGRNSRLFQSLGVLHPLLRTVMLPREFLNKRGYNIPVQIGRPIQPARLQRLADDEQVSRYLRLYTNMLGRQVPAETLPVATQRDQTDGCEIVAPTPADLLRAEIAHLGTNNLLLEQNGMQVYIARASQIPWLLQELGRLREITFRAVGEGTGRAIDLDIYDTYYRHLFIWHAEKAEIVAAYRLALVDEVVAEYGLKGLYTHSLFRYGKRLLQEIEPALELGRSFVRAEYQRQFTPLSLLWKGIGCFMVRNPRYSKLFGPVSISADYDRISRQLLVDCLGAL